MNEIDLSQKTEEFVKDTIKAISPIIMKPINNSLNQFINNTVRLIDVPEKRESVKRQVVIKAYKYAIYFGKSIKSIMGDFPPLDVILTVKSLGQLGVFMISEINNILLVASLMNILPNTPFTTNWFTPLFNPVLNIDVTIMNSVNNTRDLMIDKTLVNVRKILQRGLNDQNKIDVLMDTIFAPFVAEFLTEVFKIIFVDFKNPNGPMELPSQPPPHRTLKGGSTRKQKKGLITKYKYRKYKNNKTKNRNHRNTHNTRRRVRGH